MINKNIIIYKNFNKITYHLFLSWNILIQEGLYLIIGINFKGLDFINSFDKIIFLCKIDESISIVLPFNKFLFIE